MQRGLVAYEKRAIVHEVVFVARDAIHAYVRKLGAAHNALAGSSIRARRGAMIMTFVAVIVPDLRVGQVNVELDRFVVQNHRIVDG